MERDSLKRHLDAIAEALLAPTVCPRSNCPGKLICDAEYCPLVRIRVPEYLPDQLPEMVRALRQFVSIQNILIDQQRMADLMQSPAWEEYREAREALDAQIKEQG